MTYWAELAEELDRWAAAGRSAPFWWRDDDATDVTLALDRLLSLSTAQDVPLAIAVVPELATTALAERLRDLPSAITVLQHGCGHRDHSGLSPTAGQKRKKIELSGDRPADAVSRELRDGQEKLRRAFGDRFHSILVPPWNRIDPEILERLPDLGFEGLSTFGPLTAKDADGGNAGRLIQANSTIDIMRWRPEREFRGEDALLDQILTDLCRKRQGPDSGAEPLGLMTHHLVHDEDCWTFVSQLLEETQAHRAARWLTADEVFSPRSDKSVVQRQSI